jgi:hypothetical protein
MWGLLEGKYYISHIFQIYGIYLGLLYKQVTNESIDTGISSVYIIDVSLGDNFFNLQWQMSVVVKRLDFSNVLVLVSDILE